MSQKPVFDQLAIYVVEACGMSSSVSPSDLAKKNIFALMNVIEACVSTGNFGIALAVLNTVLFLNVNGVRWIPPALVPMISKMFVIYPEVVSRVVDVHLYVSAVDSPPIIKREKEGEVSQIPQIWGIVIEYRDLEGRRNVRCLLIKDVGGDLVPIIPTDSDCEAMCREVEKFLQNVSTPRASTPVGGGIA